MAICQVMVRDFMHGWGRHDDRGEELYSDEDLRTARQCYEDMVAEGMSHEPWHGFNLRGFIDWADGLLS